MKKITKLLLLSPLFLVGASGLTSCGGSDVSEKLTLKIINSEDYIYLDDENHDNDLVQQFKRYVQQLAIDGIIDEKFKYVDVIYDTSDTNETLYSELQTGKSDYDLINVSDYMAQKMVSEDLIIPLYKEGESREVLIPNYETYGSKTLVSRLDEITAPKRNYETGETYYVELKDYAVGYMWGTLGILFNPEYKDFKNLPYGYTVDDILNDMHYSFSCLANPYYYRSISIKNSMRDTFAAGLMSTYEDDFAALKDALDLAIEEAEGDIEKIEEAIDDYMGAFARIFNGEDEEFAQIVNKVHQTLDIIKANVFGLEVDSGKQDIVTGKIGINLAWSGDAVYAMDQAEDTELVGAGNESTLYYCVPELGSNLWFDTWVMPKNNNRSEERRELALMFLNFLSDPANAYQNMDYTGYTSFIGGEDIVDLVRDWFDVRTEEIYATVDDETYSVYASNNSEFFAVGYEDCLSSKHNSEYDNFALFYFEPYTTFIPGQGVVTVEEPASWLDLIRHGGPIYIVDEETGEETDEQKLYGDIVLADEEYDEVDLSYFFNDTFGEESTYQNNVDTVFYAEEYFTEVYADAEEYPGCFRHYDENNPEVIAYAHENNSIGRQFFTQYPDEATITRCAVMKDFGQNNTLVMKMWEEFKSSPLPTSSLVLFMVIIGAGVGLGAYFIANKMIQKKIRKKRKQAQ